MHGTELNIAGRKQALGDGEETGKIVVHEDQQTPQAAFDEAAQHQFPIFEIFAAGTGQTSEDLFSAIAAQGEHDVDAGGRKRSPSRELNIFAVEEYGEQIRIDGQAVAQIEFFDETDGRTI